MQRTFSAIARLARDVSLGTDARELVCSVVAHEHATRRSRRLSSRAATASRSRARPGVPIATDELRSVQPAASIAAFTRRAAIFVADVTRQAGVSPLIVRATGIVSILYEPILRDGEPVGVLAIAWTSPRSELDAKTTAIAQFLAAEAGAAIERSDLLARLDGQARSDPLTLAAQPAGLGRDAGAGAARRGAGLRRDDRHRPLQALQRPQRACRRRSAAARVRRRLARPPAAERHDRARRRRGVRGAASRLRVEDAARVLERLRDATPSGATASVGVAERAARRERERPAGPCRRGALRGQGQRAATDSAQLPERLRRSLRQAARPGSAGPSLAAARVRAHERVPLRALDRRRLRAAAAARSRRLSSMSSMWRCQTSGGLVGAPRRARRPSTGARRRPRR